MENSEGVNELFPNLLAHCDLGTKNDAKKRKEAGGGRGARPFYFINKAYPTTTTARSTYKTSKVKMKMVDNVLNYKKAARPRVPSSFHRITFITNTIY